MKPSTMEGVAGRVSRRAARREYWRCSTVREMKEGPFKFGNQVLISPPPQAASVKSRGCGAWKRWDEGSRSMVERGERKQTVDEVSRKRTKGMSEPGTFLRCSGDA